MSANTTISEGGKGYPFGPVKCLMVEGDNGEFYPWYPDADRALDSLNVTQNGIYRASDRGVYGWSRVSVNVPQSDSVTGRDPETGQEVTVTADPETGELVETVVPVEIRITTPPTKTEYQDGETIDISSMVVKAYGANGDEMQTVPNGQITLSPTIARYDPDADVSYATSELVDYNVPFGSVYREQDITETDDYKRTIVWVKSSSNGVFIVAHPLSSSNRTEELFASASPDGSYSLTQDVIYYDKKTGETTTTHSDGSGTVDRSYTHANKTVYMLPVNSLWRHDVITPEVFDKSPRDVDGWTVIYGDIVSGSPQTITVSWPRPGDGAVLETSFNITVTGGE